MHQQMKKAIQYLVGAVLGAAIGGAGGYFIRCIGGG